MKSIFTKLSTLLFCGVVAMVGCTDFSEDIQAVDQKVNELTASTQTELTNLKSAVAALEAKLDAQYATKEEVAALKSTLEDTIADEVAAINGDIAKVNAALKTAQEEISAAIAALDDKKADKTAVDAAIKTATEAIEKLQSDLQAAKGELEAEIAGVKAQIAATQATLEEQIAAVDAKAMENYNTLLSLSEYLGGLEAKVNEINNTLLSLSEYLPEMKAELEGKIAAVDAKAMENYYTLVSLSEHLEEYEATTDMKLVELQGSLAALSTYLEEYEASVDAKFQEILATFESLSIFLDDKFDGIEAKLAALDETDTDLYKEIDGLRVALTNVNNLLEDEVKARQNADEELYKKISEETQEKVEELQEMFTNLINLLEAEAAARQEADNEIYVEIYNLRTHVGQVYNALSLDIATVDAALKAHIAAFEAYKAQIAVALKDLQLNDDAISERLAMHTDKLTKIIDAKVAELQAQDEELWIKVNNLEMYLSQAIAMLQTEMDDKDAAMYKELTEEIESVQRGLQASLTNVNNLVSDLREEFDALVLRVAANEDAIETIVDAIDQLTEWLKTNDANDAYISQVVNTLVDDLHKAIADIQNLQKETGDIKDLIYETSTDLTNLIDKANETIQGLKDLCSDLQNQIGANKDEIYALQVLVNNINKNFGERLEALENQVGANAEAIKKLVERVQSLVYVPDYSDHKATIEWAMISTTNVMPAAAENDVPAYSIVNKTTDLKYLVKANAGEDAVTAAAEIKDAWKDALDYNVTDVTTRGAAKSGADLEIVNVEADGEYIIVSVVAKNFDAKFFENKRQGIYSAALVLGDKNGNNMTSEYTNLVPGKAAEVKAVILAGDKKTNITNTVVDETLYLQYDLTETVTPLDGHAVYFQEGDKTYSVEGLQEAGYDVKIDTKAITTLSANNTKTLVPTSINMNQPILQGGFKYVPNPKTKYWGVSLKETLDKESFLKINGTEEQDVELKYIYTVNGVEIFAAQNVEISKRTVNVNLPVITVPWTVAEAESLMAGGVTYSVDLVKEQTYDINTAADKSLEGYTLASVMNRTAADKKVYINDEVVETADIKIQVKDRQETTYKMILGNRFDGNAKSYSFPVNNNDEKDDWNTYKATWTYELEDMKVFVTGTMQLGEQAPVQDVTVDDVDFKVMKNTNGWLTGSADVLTVAYNQFERYLGYADEATNKAKFLALFVGENNAIRYKETTVNEKAVDYMKNTPYTGFEPQNFKLHSSSLTAPVEFKYPVQVIKQVVKPWFGIDFNFIVNGNIVLPKDVLNYSTVDFVTYSDSLKRWQVEVDGDIVADQSVEHGRKYNIDQADLGKYFYVSDEAEYGVDRMLTVKFEILTKNAPLPETTVVEVFEDATSQINVLEEGKSVIKDWTNGGNFVGNEIEVKATLLANGFAIDDKYVTLFTIDPLTFSKVPEVEIEGVDIQVERVPGMNAVVDAYRVLSLTSVAEEGNLINTAAKSGAGLFYFSHADDVYGAEFILHPEDEPTWTSQILGVYTKEGDEKEAYHGTKYDFTNGTITLKADSGQLKQSIFAEVEFELTHNYNYGKNQTVTVVIEFVPNNEY